MTSGSPRDNDSRQAASADTPAGEAAPNHDPSLETLREILFSHDRQRITDLEERLTDPETLVSTISPVLSDAIRRKIRDNRDEMIEALYPVIGQAVIRAVSEAIQDLTRTVDARMRTSFNWQTIVRRWQARVRGVSGAEMALRESLPFQVSEIFLIHRETGLLLQHISPTPNISPDSDLISGMLTAIRDFVQESFGRGKEAQLDEIQYGEQSILIETAQYAYLAVVIEGTEPPGFRAEMRERIVEISHTYNQTLRQYQGDTAPLSTAEPALRSLFASYTTQSLSASQKWILISIAVIMIICLLTVGVAGNWGWHALQPSPTSTATTIVLPTATPTHTNTSTPIPTATSTAMPTSTSTATTTPTHTPLPTNTPTATATFTPTPTIGLMTGNVWLRETPSDDSSRISIVLETGQSVEILETSNNWHRVRWIPPQADAAEVIGWVPVRWVGIASPMPQRLITPAPTP